MLVRTIGAFAVVVILLFGAAGTFRFWLAWVYFGVLAIPFTYFSFYLVGRDPELGERRLRKREDVGEQKLLAGFLALIMPVGLLLCGLDYCWSWSRILGGRVPIWLSVVSDLVVLGGILLVFRVFQVNSFAARTVRVEANQKVIASGPYRWVRHPMYTGSLLMMLASPLALGSWIAVPFFALSILIYILRLLHEEKLLRSELDGYAEYCGRTRYRLVPFVW